MTTVPSTWEEAEVAGVVRFRVEPDQDVDLDDILGDAYDHKVNPGILPAVLDAQRRDEIERIERDGVWGIVAEYACPCCGQWIVSDSCWGFVGDDWKNSGYDDDVKQMTLDTAREVYARANGA